MLHATSIKVSIRRPHTPLLCTVDEKLISQAMLNLVINARDAMSNGGDLTITTVAEDRWAIIRVADTGIGIGEKDQDRILRPFFSTKAKGSGLGLSITRRIVLEHGGELSFTSRPGEGTTFTVRLPLETPASIDRGATG
jgi:signal transduction histidine kinase